MAKKVAIGEADSFQDRREKVLQWLTKIGVSAERAFSALGIKGIDDLNQEHLVTLTGFKTAIKDGEITVEEAFPPIAAERAKKEASKVSFETKAEVLEGKEGE